MAIGWTSTRQASHAAVQGTGVVIDGLDVIVSDFAREADEIRPRAERLVVAAAARAAQRQRDTVAVDEGDVLDSITSDEYATVDGLAVYADAGPDHDANANAYVGRFLEVGTVKMDARPFVGPSADAALPELEAGIRALSRL